jgi:hypothetical protein
MTYEVDRSGQAEMEKLSRSTFSERKIMSTKTSIKRIAAVAAVALTLGGFSAVSAFADSAAAGNIALRVANGDGTLVTAIDTAGNNAAGGVAGIANTVKVTYDAQAHAVRLPGSSTTSYTAKNAIVSVSGAGAYFTAITNVAGSSYAGSASTAASPANALVGTNPTTVAIASTSGGALTIATPQVGTVTVSYYTETAASSGIYSATALETVTFTIAAASVVGTLSVTNTKLDLSGQTTSSIFSNAASTTWAADDTVLAPKGTTSVAIIRVRLKDTQGATGSALSGKTVSASIAGPGLLTAVTGAAGTDTTTVGSLSAAARVASAVTDVNGVAFVQILGDGTTGTGTVTLSVGTTILGTKTVTFYSTTPSAIAGTQVLSVAAAATALGKGSALVAADGVSVATNAAIVITAKDANGNLVAGLGSVGTWSATSSDTTCMSKSISVYEEDPVNGYNGAGYYDVKVNGAAAATSGCKANITVTWTSADTLTTVSTAAFPFSIGGTTVYGIKLSTDAATYNIGDKIKMTATMTDKAGNAVADGDYALFTAASTGVFATSAALTSTLFGTTGTRVVIGGVNSSSFYAPLAGGSLAVSTTLPAAAPYAAALQATALSTTVAITNPSDAASQAAVDAANEATDAANAATDAANNAMDSADAAQQAALDAGDKADAALAAVTDLATKVSAIATQIAALSALVKKIAAKVKA